ncbi:PROTOPORPHYRINOGEN OXIDASE [Salix viminalis]|uniref:PROTOPORPHYRINOGEN OXIDASE n=1 Tax=Salix viminalis TaxID=40686 RepID=A0A9Q0NSF9_SALVM|nr:PROTOPORPHYRINOGEN OXIDASE [Salix viminalis]
MDRGQTIRSATFLPFKLNGEAQSRAGHSASADYVIVGGGISGLCIAQALANNHWDVAPNVIVTEARDCVGGNITTLERDGYLWEEGPNSFQPSDSMLTMVQVGSGLKEDLVVGDLMRRVLAGFGALGLRPPPPGHEEPVEEFVRRNLGDEVFERLIEPFLYRCLCGREVKNPSHLETRVFQHPKGQTVESFREGLAMLPDAIATRLGSNVKLFWKLSSIIKLENGGIV